MKTKKRLWTLFLDVRITDRFRPTGGRRATARRGKAPRKRTGGRICRLINQHYIFHLAVINQKTKRLNNSTSEATQHFNISTNKKNDSN